MSSSSAAGTGGGGGDGAARVNIICSICMVTLMEDGSVQVATSCGHVYHRHCLINWYTSSEQYCCPICWKTTESDSNCEFRVFLDTEEDSDYLALLQKVTNLRREKEEMHQEKANALERLKKQMETVDRLRLEHSEKVERLQQEHDEQFKRLQRDHVDILREETDKTKTLERNIQQLQENAQSLEQLRQEQMEAMDHLRLEHSEKVQRLQQEQDILREETMTLERTIQRLRQENREVFEKLSQEQIERCDKMKRLRQEHSNEKGQLLLLIQSQKNEIQLLKDEIQWQKEEIQNLKRPIDLLHERVKTLASEELQQEEDELMKKFKRLDEAGGGSFGGGVRDRLEATGFRCGCTASVSQELYRIRPFARKSTAGSYRGWQVGALASSGRDAAAAACGSGVQGTSSSTPSSVGAKFTNTLSKGPDLEIISETQEPIIVPATSTPPQQRSSSEKKGVSAAEGSGVASKTQSGGGECDGSEATGIGFNTARKSAVRLTPSLMREVAYKAALAVTGRMRLTSSSSTPSAATKVTTLSKRPELEIILEKQKSINVPTTSATLCQHRSSSEKRGVSAADGFGVASKMQKIDDNANNCGPIKPTLQRDMTKETNELVEKSPRKKQQPHSSGVKRRGMNTGRRGGKR